MSFYQKTTSGLGQTFSTEISWSVWGIFGRTSSTHICTVSSLPMFSIIQPLLLQKTKPLYPSFKCLFGSGIWIWAANNLRSSLRVSVVREWNLVQSRGIWHFLAHGALKKFHYKIILREISKSDTEVLLIMIDNEIRQQSGLTYVPSLTWEWCTNYTIPTELFLRFRIIDCPPCNLPTNHNMSFENYVTSVDIPT